MNQNSGKRRWLTNKKIFSIVLLLLAAGYIAAHPMLEKWFGVDLPNPIAQDEKPGADDANADTQQAGDAGNDQVVNSDKTADKQPLAGQEFELTSMAGGALRSPAGLVYQQTSREHRIDHVLRHAKDVPERNIHGVFDGNRDQVLKLIDDAYRLIKADSSHVATKTDGRRTEYKINMRRRIGYVGGQVGKRNNYPVCQHLQLVLENNNVITAYPVNR